MIDASSMPVIRTPFGWNDNQRPDFPKSSYNNEITFERGIPSGFSVPAANGGVPFNRHMMNQIGTLCTISGYMAQAGIQPTFRRDVSTAIGGYPKGAVLKYFRKNQAGNIIGVADVVSQIDNNIFDFTGETTPWCAVGGKISGQGRQEYDGKVAWNYVYTESDTSGLFPDFSTAMLKYEHVFSATSTSQEFQVGDSRVWALVNVTVGNWSPEIDVSSNKFKCNFITLNARFPTATDPGAGNSIILSNVSSVFSNRYGALVPLPVSCNWSVSAEITDANHPMTVKVYIMKGMS